MSAVPPQRGNGFVAGALTPVESALSSFPLTAPVAVQPSAAGSALGVNYPASARRGLELDANWDFRPGEIIVKLKNTDLTVAQTDFLTSLQLRVHREAPERILLLRSEQIEAVSPLQMAELVPT